MEGRLRRMKTDSERIELMHKRARRIRNKDEFIRIAAYAAASIILLIGITAITMLESGAQHSIEGGQLVGTSMLDSNVGGYVLVAVIAFVVAVILTVVLIRYRDRSKKEDDIFKPLNDDEGTGL